MTHYSKITEKQTREIFMWMLSGKSISQKTAYEMFDCLRLSARIYDIRNIYGIPVESKMVHEGEKTYARYSLTGKTIQEQLKLKQEAA